MGGGVEEYLSEKQVLNLFFLSVYILGLYS